MLVITIIIFVQLQTDFIYVKEIYKYSIISVKQNKTNK
jgi:hypothetical protein